MSNNQLKTIFNQEVIADLAQRIKKVSPSFDSIGFQQDANQNLDDLELKQRSTQICTALTSYLPSEFEQAVSILLEAMGKDNSSGGLEGYHGFRFMPFLDFVAAQGLDNPDIALDSLEKMTLYFSAEFAIRPFILKYPEKTLPRFVNILLGKHKFKQRSTRTYYPGLHSIELVVNGRSVDKYDFELIENV